MRQKITNWARQEWKALLATRFQLSRLVLASAIVVVASAITGNDWLLSGLGLIWREYVLEKLEVLPAKQKRRPKAAQGEGEI